MPPRPSIFVCVPFVPLLVGLLASAVRFRTDDAVGGLVFALGGVVLMLAVATWMFRSADTG